MCCVLAHPAWGAVLSCHSIFRACCAAAPVSHTFEGCWCASGVHLACIIAGLRPFLPAHGGCPVCTLCGCVCQPALAVFGWEGIRHGMGVEFLDAVHKQQQAWVWRAWHRLTTFKGKVRRIFHDITRARSSAALLSAQLVSLRTSLYVPKYDVSYQQERVVTHAASWLSVLKICASELLPFFYGEMSKVHGRTALVPTIGWSWLKPTLAKW